MERVKITTRIKDWLDATSVGRYGLLTSEQFRSLIRREISRSDRFNLSFSLVTIEFDELERALNREKEVIKLLQYHCRGYDEIGWIENNTMGVLLYNSSRADAEKFVSRISPLKVHNIPHTIFTFPEVWLDDNKGLKSGNDFYKTGGNGFPKSNGGNGSSNFDSGSPHRVNENLTTHSVNENLLKFEPSPLPLWKRTLDISISLSLITLLSPLFALIAIVIKTVSKGPVLFSQKRVGYNGKEFNFYKFRTMKINNSCNNHKLLTTDLISTDKPMTKLYNDPRIILFGKFIRNTSLDELPQLFNVLKGDMSIVGPRPCLPYEADNFKRWHHQRFYAIPGLTGLWQVSGKNRLTFKQMVRLDISYLHHLSLLQDLKICLKTPLAILEELKEAYHQHGKLLYH